jgi:hypothetical protein
MRTIQALIAIKLQMTSQETTMNKKTIKNKSLLLLTIAASLTMIVLFSAGASAYSSGVSSSLQETIEELLKATFPSLAAQLAPESEFYPRTRNINGREVSGLEVGPTSAGSGDHPRKQTQTNPSARNAAARSEASVAAFFPKSYGDAVVIDGYGMTATMKPLETLSSTARVEGGKLAYYGAFRDSDVLRSGSIQRTECLLLRSKEAPARFEYELRASGAASISIKDGAVFIGNSNGGAIAIEAPWVLDANGQRPAGTARWEMIEEGGRGNQKLTLVLNSADLTYPVVVGHGWALKRSGPKSKPRIATASCSVVGITDPSVVQSPQVYDFSQDGDGSVPSVFPGGTFSGGGSVSIVGDDWVTWNPQEDGLHVLFATSGVATVSFNSPQQAVALKAEPNVFDVFNITIQGFDSDNNLLGSFSLAIEGDAGASFLGLQSCASNISSIVISSDPGAEGFAFTDLTYGSVTCKVGDAINVQLPQVFLPVTNPSKFLEVGYGALGLTFTTIDPGASPNVLCEAQSNVGSLPVLFKLAPGTTFNPTVPLCSSVASASLTVFKPATTGTLPTCNFRGGTTNGCILNGSFDPSAHYAQWHTSGFATKCVGVTIPGATTVPLTFWVNLEGLGLSPDVTSAQNLSTTFQTAETYIHTTLIQNLPTIAKYVFLQDPGSVNLLIRNQNNLETGIPPNGSLLAQIPGSFYFQSPTNPAVVIPNFTDGTYQITVTGVTSGPFDLSVLTTNIPLSTAQATVQGNIAQGASIIYTVKIATGSNGALNLTLFDTCLKDNTTGDMLQFNSKTGAYQFTNCSNGSTISGTGTTKVVGSILYLTDNQPTQKVSASFLTNQLTGSATLTSVMAPGVSQTFRINDTNPHATCACN